MSEDVCLLVTLYQHHELGDSLLRCAVKVPRWPDFDADYLMEDRKQVEGLLPEHVRSVGPIVAIEQIFEVVESA